MKSLVLLIVLLARAGPMFAQGSIDFGNHVPFSTPADRLVYLADLGGTKLVGTNWVAQLYYGHDIGSVVSLTNAPSRFRISTTTFPGTWVGETSILEGFISGDQVILVVKVWDGSLFPTFEEALAANGTRGVSAPFTYTVPPYAAAPAAFFMENFRAFALQNPMINHPPIALPQNLSVVEDTGFPISLTAIDPDLDLLTYSLVIPPVHGTLSGTPPSLTYHPATNYNGPDAFTFTASDTQATSAAATVSITVLPVNDPPVAVSASLFVAKNHRASVILRALDPENDPLTYFVTLPGHGSLNGALPNVEYTPDNGYSGPDSFTFIANDGQANSGVATITITVSPVNETPVAVARTLSSSLFSGSPGGTVLIAPDNRHAAMVLAGSGSSDPDHDGLHYAWFVPGRTQPFATGPRVTNRVEVGSHKINLQVSDGEDTATTTLTVEVITPAMAAEAIRKRVELAQLPGKVRTDLIRDLKSAEVAFESERVGSGIHWIQTFQKDLHQQLATRSSSLEQRLILEAQQIIDALRG